MKISFWVGCLGVFLTQSVHSVPLEKRHDPNSEYFIDYLYLDKILEGSVLDIGPSTHRPPKRKVTKTTGSRVQVGNVRITRQEGNRVMLHAFKEAEIDFLNTLRDELLAIPASLPLAKLSRNEQLAYWLNLYTTIVLAEIAEQYPVTRLEPLFDLDDPDAFVNHAQFQLAGQPITLADIEEHVSTNWNDPVVIYGFYMGAVGTPNIRTSAFRGKDVYNQLRENAVDFVNSMRGTQIWNPSKLLVSNYYRRMSHYFPDFENGIQRHIKEYAKPSFKRRLVTVRDVSAKIDDWNIADLYNGNLAEPGGNYPRITKDQFGVSYKLRLPLHAVRLLRDREIKFIRQRAKVEVEELPSRDNPD